MARRSRLQDRMAVLDRGSYASEGREPRSDIDTASGRCGGNAGCGGCVGAAGGESCCRRTPSRRHLAGPRPRYPWYPLRRSARHADKQAGSAFRCRRARACERAHREFGPATGRKLFGGYSNWPRRIPTRTRLSGQREVFGRYGRPDARRQSMSPSAWQRRSTSCSRLRARRALLQLRNWE